MASIKSITLVLSVILVIVGISLGLYFGLRENSDEDENIPENVKILKNYIYKDDGYFQWSRTAWSDRQISQDEAEYKNLLNLTSSEHIDLIRMTSQKWLNSSYVSKSIWEHNVWMCVPKKSNTNADLTALLWIENGDNKEFEPKFNDFEKLICRVGAAMNSVVIYLKEIPNEPVVFYDDPTLTPVKEDGEIAYTWRAFLRDGAEPEVLLRFPMVKAAVKAMDMASEYVQKYGFRDQPLSKVSVGGGSKRAWTSWITAAVDPRIELLFPVVDDLVDLQTTLHNHYKSLGGWSFALWEYWSRDIMYYLDDPKFKEMCTYIDPFYHKEVLKKIPKQIVSASGDFLFLTDDANSWWDKEWMENSYLRILPNVQHGGANHAKYTNQAAISFQAMQQAMVLGYDLPEFDWENDAEEGRIVGCTDIEPHQIVIWHGVSDSPIGRDFRLVRRKEGSIVPPSPNLQSDPVESTEQNDEIFEPTVVCNIRDLPVPETNILTLPRPNKACQSIEKSASEKKFCYTLKNIKPDVSGNFSATFMEVTWVQEPNSKHFTVTGGALVLPDRYDYEDCSGHACNGTLV